MEVIVRLGINHSWAVLNPIDNTQYIALALGLTLGLVNTQHKDVLHGKGCTGHITIVWITG